MDQISLNGVIPPVKFNKIPDDGIIDDIQREDLSIEFFSLQKEKQDKKIREIQDRFIKLCGMKRGTQGYSGKLMRIFVMKTHAPRHCAFTPITATRRKTSNTAESVPQSQSGANEICCSPDGKLVLAEIPDGKNNTECEASLKYSS
jgi:hypothetical protein